MTDVMVEKNAVMNGDASNSTNDEGQRQNLPEKGIQKKKIIRKDANTAATLDFCQSNEADEFHPTRKKQRMNPSTPQHCEDPDSFNAIEKLLSVPLDYIVRRTSSHNNNPRLLSRMEAALLLQITTISYELDSLFQMSIEAIEKSHTCKSISDELDSSGNVFLRPLHCLLHTHGRIIPQQAIQHVQNNVENIFGHVPVIIQSLRQCAEQNWSVSNALLDMNVTGVSVNMLGKEKGLLAEIEEEVCKRLEVLMNVCNEDGGTLPVLDSFDSVSMENFCYHLFNAEGSFHDCSDGIENEGHQLSLQNRSASIQDAATALGLLANDSVNSPNSNNADIDV